MITVYHRKGNRCRYIYAGGKNIAATNDLCVDNRLRLMSSDGVENCGLSDVTADYDILFDGPTIIGLKRKVRQYTAAEALAEPGVYRSTSYCEPAARFVVTNDGNAAGYKDTSEQWLFVNQDGTIFRQRGSSLAQCGPFVRCDDEILKAVKK